MYTEQYWNKLKEKLGARGEIAWGFLNAGVYIYKKRKHDESLDTDALVITVGDVSLRYPFPDRTN